MINLKRLQIILLVSVFLFNLSAPSISAASFVVPFTSQAPLGKWEDQRQQDGCEEAAALMAMAWVKSEQNITKAEWEKRIIAVSNFEKEKYGEYRDVSLTDIVAWIFKDYFKYDNVTIKEIKSVNDLKAELAAGKLILAPTNGQALKNPYFTAPGPERHMIVIKGYDEKTKKFITNDPGTRRGENFCYNENIILQAIRPYPTGYHKPIEDTVKQVIVVDKK